MNLRKIDHSLFATQSLSGHLVRGAVAFALFYYAVSRQHAHPGWALLAGALALVAMRGCPMCWTIGLVETLIYRIRGPRVPPGARSRRLAEDPA